MVIYSDFSAAMIRCTEKKFKIISDILYTRDTIFYISILGKKGKRDDRRLNSKDTHTKR